MEGGGWIFFLPHPLLAAGRKERASTKQQQNNKEKRREGQQMIGSFVPNTALPSNQKEPPPPPPQVGRLLLCYCNPIFFFVCPGFSFLLIRAKSQGGENKQKTLPQDFFLISLSRCHNRCCSSPLLNKGSFLSLPRSVQLSQGWNWMFLNDGGAEIPNFLL